jgi:hypothetical protein
MRFQSRGVERFTVWLKTASILEKRRKMNLRCFKFLIFGARNLIAGFLIIKDVIGVENIANLFAAKFILRGKRVFATGS